MTLDVHLPADADAAERLAERALGTVVALLDKGTPVLLATTEDVGPACRAVGDRRSAGRRLARAVADTAGRRGHAHRPARRSTERAVKLLETVRRANRPGPPEHSIRLRVACAGAVMTGIGACRAEGELSALVTAARWRSWRRA